MLSNQKAKEGLGWEPQVLLADGLQRTMDYFLRIDMSYLIGQNGMVNE